MKHAFFLAAGVALACACTLDERRPSVQESFAQHLEFPGLMPVPGPLVPGSPAGPQPVAVPFLSSPSIAPSGSSFLNVPWLGGPIASANVQVEEEEHYSVPAGSAGEQESGTIEINISLDSAACGGLAPICHEVAYSTQVVTIDGTTSLIIVSSSVLNCSSGDCAPLADRPLGDSGLVVRDVLGLYSGDWGDMLLRQVGDELWGAYTFWDGTVVGSIVDGVLRGWWSETPSRAPLADAGEVEFRWLRTEAGQVAINGRWRNGLTGPWYENFDVALVTDREPAPALVERFEDASVFLRHP